MLSSVDKALRFESKKLNNSEMSLQRNPSLLVLDISSEDFNELDDGQEDRIEGVSSCSLVGCTIGWLDTVRKLCIPSEYSLRLNFNR